MTRARILSASLALLTLACGKDDPPPAPQAAAQGIPSVAPSVAAPAAPPAASAAADSPADTAPTFEGEMDLTIETKSPKASTMKATMLLKAGKMRMNLAEPVGEQVSQIIDTNTGKMISLAHGPKIAMDMNMKGILGSLAPWMPKNVEGDPERPDLKKTDRTEQIAGHTCRYWEYTYKHGERGSACLAKLGSGWVHLGGLDEAKWAQKAFEGHRFPLKYVNYDTAGKESATMVVTRLEEKSVADSEFEVPAGYKRMDTSKMMEGLLPAMMAGAKGAAKPEQMTMPPDMKEMLEKLKRGEKPKP